MAVIHWTSQKSLNEKLSAPAPSVVMRAIVQLTTSALDLENVNEETYSIALPLFEPWSNFVGGTLDQGKVVRYEGVLYKTISTHQSQSHLTPTDANYLFFKYTPKGQIEEWEQRDYRNPYMIGDQVKWNGKIYTCIIDKTTHNPTDAPANWKQE